MNTEYTEEHLDELALRKEWMGEANKISNVEELNKFITKITEFNHGYGTIVRGMAAVMKAAYAVINNSPQGGITGFQAGCLMWEMIREFGMYGENSPLGIVDYSDLLYPQCENKFTTISKDVWEVIQKKAKANLEKFREDNTANVDVFRHWEDVAQGIVPFGLKVKG